MAQNPQIFKLHDDLLEHIFLTLVLADSPSKSISPVVLSHVCRRWRFVARSSARLWTKIDMTSPRKAREFCALSKHANLSVHWTLNSSGTDSEERATREWIWLHASRFQDLQITDSLEGVGHILSSYGRQFQNLVTLTIMGEGLPRSALHIPFDIESSRLVSLSLRNFCVSLHDLFNVLGSAPALHTAMFNSLVFTNVKKYERTPPSAPSTAALNTKTQLRELCLEHIGSAAQRLLLGFLSLPSSHLAIAEVVKPPSRFPNVHPLLHPKVEASLGRLDFTTLLLRSDSMELCERDSYSLGADHDAIVHGDAQSSVVDPTRCTLSLRATGLYFHVLLLFPAPFVMPRVDLSRVRTLVLTDVDHDHVLAFGPDMYRKLCAVSKLILHNSWWLGKALLRMGELRGIHVRETDLTALDGLVLELVEGIRQRKLNERDEERDEVVLRPVEHVIFERCTGVEGNIDVLRNEVDVIVIE